MLYNQLKCVRQIFIGVNTEQIEYPCDEWKRKTILLDDELRIENTESLSMLIRWANENDLPAWCALATEVSPIFQHPADMGTDPEFISYTRSKVNNYEVLAAVDYMSGNKMGFIGFSRTNNHISWFAVSGQYRGKGAGERLLKTALRQLDTNKDITVITFLDGYSQGVAARTLYKKYGFTEERLIIHDNLPRCEMKRPASTEKRGGSFHYLYPEFIKAADIAFCPVCNGEPAPERQTDIQINKKVFVCGEYPGQGRLFGKMYVMPRKHYYHFEDMPPTEMVDFMSEVQRVGAALRKVTGAVKINYEIHSNSGAHIHIHLFPRYLDDEFPGAPIDFRITEPAPYESYEEFLWFVEQMKKELQLTQNMPYYLAYEKRYQAVYASGATVWGHQPDDEILVATLTEWVNKNDLKGKKVIEYACGEGSVGVILSKLGCVYKGVDIAPSAVERSKQVLAPYSSATVSLMDMVNEPVNDVFDAAIDCMGFHMLIIDSDRRKYLANVIATLKPGAPMLFFRQDYHADAYSGEVASYEEWKAISGSDYETPSIRHVTNNGKEYKVNIPLVPARAKNKEDYIAEMTTAGFVVDQFIVMEPSRAILNAVSIYVHKNGLK